MSPIASPPGEPDPHSVGKARYLLLVTLTVLLGLCLTFMWTTRGVMAHLPFLAQQGRAGNPGARGNLVDISPWETARALAPLAVTEEELRYAHEAERLADHEVDQAFASALRSATLRQQSRTLTGEALALSQKVQQFQQIIKEDQAQVASLSAKAGPSSSAPRGDQPSADSDALEMAKAQLGLDSDQLADAQHDLQRASGDQSVRIQEELAAHEASMRQYDSEAKSEGQVAVLSERRHGTLSSRLQAWFSLRDRLKLIRQAQQEAQAGASALIAAHNTMEAKANAAAGSPDAASGQLSALDRIRERRAARQILSTYDDRIQTEQQLAGVYGKWSAQVLLQRRIVLHLLLDSLALILWIAVCVVLCDALVRRLMDRGSRDRRQTQTLRSILEVGIQVLGLVLILVVIFGVPQQTPTILGLATAALTIALQDFILAFLGWFVLVGKHGIRVGDWVEINGVGGEVTEVGLFRTTLMETGTLADKGHPTGRRITFINSFAIRGQFFNFSSAGQWMWDEITVEMPVTDDLQNLVEQVHQVVMQETEHNSRDAEAEWKRGSRAEGLSRFSATPAVDLRPSGAGIEVHVRYVTRASNRFDLRNRLYQRMVELLRPQRSSHPEQQQAAGLD
ncbi:MAG TPA: mechanosensitive ion channel domain-containing protein [Terracidiphilus sp.]|nr:mechanosensitive ion channel domain-containing protein [Terracidiphilus sp.]